ncbi:MAG: tripartite tricarboxylate transporter permease [Planctomycetota bacterium]|nr:tripartite tricarboxylate transporter permease [Planctomycetota bacterium]
MFYHARMDLSAAIQYVFTPAPLLLMMLGTALGIIVGAIPGLTGAMLISLTLPLTFTMPYGEAMVLLVSMYVGSISGGLITATLLRMPGTPASMMTTLDGYPLAKSGQPGRALGLGISASFVGGLVSWGFLAALAKPMADWSTRLGNFEFFALVLLALVSIASVAGESLLKGLLAGMLGILLPLPGIDPATSRPRLTLGFVEVNNGFELLPVLIGLFAITQIIDEILHLGRRGELVPVDRRGIWMSWSDWSAQKWNLLRSSVIGTWIGILPGIGANIGSVMAYSAAKNFSKTPEEFGCGSEEGIVASEAANNATVGGALIPLISLGIPGSVIDAILLGAMVIHRLQPGPLLFKSNPDVVYTIIATALVANVFMFVFMLLSVGWLSKLMYVPRWLLIPTVLVFCVTGSYALSNRMFDVWVMLAFGLGGFAMQKLRIPLAPFVIGFVLGRIAEDNLIGALMQSGGSYWPFFQRPISAVLLAVSAVMFVWPIVKRRSSPGSPT